MEMVAVIEGLKALRRPTSLELISDSSYVLKGIADWLPNWKRNGWKRREGTQWKPVKNEEFWRMLDELASQHELVLTHVRGHAGHPENERCDQLAVIESKKFFAKRDENV